MINAWKVAALIAGGFALFIAPLIYASVKSRREGREKRIRIGPLSYAAFVSEHKSRTRISVRDKSVFGYNRHRHRLAKGEPIRHIHLGPLVIGYHRGRIIAGIERKRRKEG